MQTIVVNQNDANQRIDSFLKKTYPKLSLSLLYRYLRIKRIKVNNKKVEPNYRLCLHDNIELFVNDEYLSKRNSKTDFLLAPTDIDIIYQDDNILIVNKPAGLVVHEDETKTNDTLINRVLHHMYKKKE
jgi:23S rRNA pseudouridine955/2504/2580 synthase